MGTLVEEDVSYVTGSVGDGQRADIPAVRLQPGEIAPGTRYRIERWLGEGGVGVVYECVHVDLERRVALKVLKASVSSQAALLFRAEAKAAVRSGDRDERGTSMHFGSPYIVEVFDFGEFPDGRLWFAMELLHGKSLSQVLKQDGKPIALGPEQTLGILRQVAKGLYAAHRAGVVHRDVKPANIMLVQRGNRRDAVKLVDFGVSAIGSESGSAMVGTPPYMAPEQTVGGTFDRRLDIYAFGCVAYRMLTGRVPFAAATLFQLLRKHREEEPEAPSSVNSSITPALEKVVLKCLAKDPEDRYETMADLEAALCEAQIDDKLRTPWDGLPLPDVAPARRERLAKLMPQRTPPARAKWLWPSVAAAAVLFAGVVSLAQRGPEEDPDAAVDDAVERLVDEARAAGARAEWVYPARSHPNGPTAYQKVLELERLKDNVTAKTMGTELRAEFAQALVALGDRYWDHPQGQAFALDYYAQAQLFDPDLGHERSRGAMTVGELALLRKRAETLDFTAEDLAATEPLAALAESDEQTRAEKLRELIEEGTPRATSAEARLEAILEEDDESEPHQPRPRRKQASEAAVQPESAPEPVAAAVPTSTPTPSSKDDSRSLAKAGAKALASADRDRAASLFNRALAANGSNAEAHMGLARIAYDRGDYGKAVKHGERAVALAARNSGYRLKLGDAYYKTFRYADARKQYVKAKELGSKAADDRIKKIDEKTGP